MVYILFACTKYNFVDYSKYDAGHVIDQALKYLDPFGWFQGVWSVHIRAQLSGMSPTQKWTVEMNPN